MKIRKSNQKLIWSPFSSLFCFSVNGWNNDEHSQSLKTNKVVSFWMHLSIHFGILISIHACSASNSTKLDKIHKQVIHRLFLFNQLINPLSVMLPLDHRILRSTNEENSPFIEKNGNNKKLSVLLFHNFLLYLQALLTNFMSIYQTTINATNPLILTRKTSTVRSVSLWTMIPIACLVLPVLELWSVFIVTQAHTLQTAVQYVYYATVGRILVRTATNVFRAARSGGPRRGARFAPPWWPSPSPLPQRWSRPWKWW